MQAAAILQVAAQTAAVRCRLIAVVQACRRKVAQVRFHLLHHHLLHLHLHLPLHLRTEIKGTTVMVVRAMEMVTEAQVNKKDKKKWPAYRNIAGHFFLWSNLTKFDN
jgi:hypothetical protein